MCCNNTAHFTDAQTQKQTHTHINCERCQPVLTRPGCNCIKAHDFPPGGKYEPSPVCAHVFEPKGLNLKKSALFIWCHSTRTKAAQRRADTGPLVHFPQPSKTCHRRPRMHSLILKDRPPWPLTYSICATPRPLTPRADSGVAPQFSDAQKPLSDPHISLTQRQE